MADKEKYWNLVSRKFLLKRKFLQGNLTKRLSAKIEIQKVKKKIFVICYYNILQESLAFLFLMNI